MGDDLPLWTQTYKVRQLLWQKYGLCWPTWSMSDVVNAISLDNAEQSHEAEMIKRAQKGK